MARKKLTPTILKNATPAYGVPFVGPAMAAAPAPAPADTRNWQQKARDWGNDMGAWLLGPHMNAALGRAGEAVQFTDAGDFMDATSSGAALGRAVQEGRFWDAAKEAPWMLAATGFAAMPGASMGPIDNAAKEALQESKKTIRAYHGSPHDFDRFDLSKIGTGEGAQAFGHGLYFAEAEDVARGYRDANQTFETLLNGKPVKPDMPEFKAVMTIGANGYDKALKQAEEFAASGFIPQTEVDAIRALKGATIKSVPRGKMYEVEIDADPDTFLDWDKPLSQQSPAVSKAMGFDQLPENMKWETAGKFYGAVSPEQAKTLSKAGVPGIKFFDSNSRGAGDGTRNFVVFDDRLISIVRKYGIAGASAMLGYNILDGMNEAQASELKSYEPKRLDPSMLKKREQKRLTPETLRGR